MRVSVVIPVFDDEEALASCLDAIGSQSFPSSEVEVLVVDNGSTTPIADPGTPNVRVLREDRPGSYHARNAALAEVRGEIIAFTDADCRPTPDWLDRGVAFLDAHPDVDLVGGRIDVFFADPAKPTPVEMYERVHAFVQQESVETEDYAATANLIVRRTVIDDVGGFEADLKSGGDVEFCKRAVAAGHAIAYADDVLVLHPARSEFGEYHRRLKRTISGARDRAAMKGEPYPFPWSAIARESLPPIPTMVRELADPSLGPLMHRGKLALATFVIHYQRWYHKLAVRFSRHSPRD